MDYDKILLKILITNKEKINISKFRKISYYNLYPNIKEYLIKRYNDSESLQESLNRIKYNIEERPKCKCCGNRVKYLGKGAYRYYCSSLCKTKSDEVKEKVRQTCLNKYGTTSPLKNKDIKEKIKETCLKKYGVTSALKSDKVKEKVRQTCLNKYGTTSPLKNKDIKEKIKETCLKKYGVINPISNPLIYNKVKNTCISKYGVPYLMQNIKIKNKSKETCIKKYGISNAGGSIEVQNKIKQTILNHYGVDCYFKTKECRNKSNSPEIIQKIIETKRKNHTFNTSKPEEELYLYIKGKFPNVKRQYKDKERYPWCCDFYISELDYFIELQGYYTHGKHPYNPNSEEDNKLIEKYKRKYGPNCQAITIWTIKDVEKRNKAKEEKLNFKEVWTLEEGKEFIDSLFYANTKSENRTN